MHLWLKIISWMWRKISRGWANLFKKKNKVFKVIKIIILFNSNGVDEVYNKYLYQFSLSVICTAKELWSSHVQKNVTCHSIAFLGTRSIKFKWITSNYIIFKIIERHLNSYWGSNLEWVKEKRFIFPFEEYRLQRLM